MNKDYVTEYKAQTVDGVQTVTFKINPKAAQASRLWTAIPAT